MLRFSVPVVGVVSLVLVLAGCSAQAPNERSAISVPPSSAAASPTNVPSSPTPSKSAPVRYTCGTLVDPYVVAKYLDYGAELDAEWPNETENYGTFYQLFAEYGGVSCRWGVAQGDKVRYYSYAPVTADQATNMQARLIAEDYTTADRSGGVVYIAPFVPGDFYLFTDDAVYETSGAESFTELVPFQRRSL